MTKVIAIANQKGGVGKTSTTVNLGAGLVRQGYAVLAIDFDPQANLTMALGFKSPDDMEYTVSNVLAKAMDEEPIDPAEGILTTEEGVDLMPSSIQLSRYELSLVNEMNRESMLRQFVDAAKPNYDYITYAPFLNTKSKDGKVDIVLGAKQLSFANHILSKVGYRNIEPGTGAHVELMNEKDKEAIGEMNFENSSGTSKKNDTPSRTDSRDSRETSLGRDTRPSSSRKPSVEKKLEENKRKLEKQRKKERPREKSREKTKTKSTGKDR